MSEPSAPTVRLHRDGAIATLTLDRPAARNALDLPMACALRDAAAAVAADPAVRVLRIDSSSAHFMVGGDVHRFNALLDDGPAACREEVDQIITAVHAAIRTLVALPCPVIGLAGGSVAGFGFSLAMACDLLVAADDARFVLAYSAIGTTPDGGSTWHLPRLLGLRRAMAVALLNTPIDAREALALGLVCEVVPAAELAAAGQRLAERLAAGPAGAQAGIKQLLRAALDRDLPGALDAEHARFLDSVMQPDFAEGVRAFAARRPARFGAGD
ncbi:MAG: enoyl-CoA hydratase-related protein [Rhodocyclaceae bacterium]